MIWIVQSLKVVDYKDSFDDPAYIEFKDLNESVIFKKRVFFIDMNIITSSISCPGNAELQLLYLSRL